MKKRRMPLLSSLLLCLSLAPGMLYAAGEASPLTEVTADALLQRQASSEKVLVIDVRTPEEFAQGHVPGAINLAHDTISGREPVLAGWTNETVVLYCRSGRRVGIAAAVLERQGFMKLEHLQRDMPGWEKAGKSVEK